MKTYLPLGSTSVFANNLTSSLCTAIYFKCTVLLEVSERNQKMKSTFGVNTYFCTTKMALGMTFPPASLSPRYARSTVRCPATGKTRRRARFNVVVDVRTSPPHPSQSQGRQPA